MRSDVPTLFLAGSFDAVTPPSWARAAARHLTNSLVVTVPGVGHGVADASPCAVHVMNSYLKRPGAPDTGCVAGLPPPFARLTAQPIAAKVEQLFKN
ncbi:MAG: alpha/beta hydrolase [Geminicoccaceae bacterium]